MVTGKNLLKMMEIRLFNFCLSEHHSCPTLAKLTRAARSRLIGALQLFIDELLVSFDF
jgi:hypothetical protein